MFDQTSKNNLLTIEAINNIETILAQFLFLFKCSLHEVLFERKAEITLIIPDLDNASEGRENTRLRVTPELFVLCNVIFVCVVIGKMHMRSTIAGLIVLVLTSLSFACKKDIAGDESDLYGTWMKGSNSGDTLWFMKKNGKDIIRIPESFNPLLPSYAEKEYQLKGEVLNIRSFAPSSQEYFPITSFKWTDPGKEFTITNSQLFMFMSSIVTYKYRKI